MHLIADVIKITLDTLYDKGVIDLDNEIEEFCGECEIEYDFTQPNGVTIVTMCGWYVFIWWMHTTQGATLEAYHAQSIALVCCDGCGASVPESELRDFHGRRLCDYCRWVGVPPRKEEEHA